MRTLNANFINAIGRRGARLRFLLSITDGTTTWEAIDKPCDEFRLPSAITMVAPFSAEVDPITREMTTGNVDVVVRDPWIRPIATANKLKGQEVTVKIGEASLAKTDFENYFVGPFGATFPDHESSTVRIEVRDAVSLLDGKMIAGLWWGEHPLDIVKDIFQNKIPLHSSQYNTTDLDPSQSQYSSVSHFVANRSDAGNSTDSSMRKKESAREAVRQLTQMVNGTTHVDENGVIRVSRFDASAANVATLTQDEIGMIEQDGDNEHVVNSVTVNFKPTQANFTDPDARAGYTSSYTRKNTDSQSDYAFPGSSTGTHDVEINCDWFGAQSRLIPSMNTSSTEAVLSHDQIHNFSGMRDAYPFGSQPSDAQASSSRLLYLRSAGLYDATDPGGSVFHRGDTYHEEIFSAESLTHNTAFYGTRYAYDPDAGRRVQTGPYAWRTTAGTLARNIGTLRDTEPTAVFSGVEDITYPYWIADQILGRFANGAARINLTVSLRHFALEVGDFVGVVWPEYMAWGADGLDGTEKWEIVKKEVHADDNEPHIALSLVSAETISYVSAHDVVPLLGAHAIHSAAVNAMADAQVTEMHRLSGLVASTAAGLDLDITPGEISFGHGSMSIPKDTTLALTASKDNYVFVDVDSQGLSVEEVTLGGGAPTASTGQKLIAKVITGASISSIDQTMVLERGVRMNKLLFGASHAYLNSGNQSLPFKTATKIKFDASEYDDYGDFEHTANYEWTAPRDGKIDVSAYVTIDNLTSAITGYIQLRRTRSAVTTTIRQRDIRNEAAATVANIRIMADWPGIETQEGDTFHIDAYQNESSTNRNIVTGALNTWATFREIG